MSEPYLAEVHMVGFNFAPRGYAQCDGQLLPINQNQSLYSLLGTTYGGDGRTSFGLPDLRGRIPFHTGYNITLGHRSGTESVQLTTNELPEHTHDLQCAQTVGNSSSPESNLLAESAFGDLQYSSATSKPVYSGRTANNGYGAEHDNMPPYLAINFVIALTGLFPSIN